MRAALRKHESEYDMNEEIHSDDASGFNTEDDDAFLTGKTPTLRERSWAARRRALNRGPCDREEGKQAPPWPTLARPLITFAGAATPTSSGLLLDPTSLFCLLLLPVPLIWRNDRIMVASSAETTAYLTAWPLIVWAVVGACVVWITKSGDCRPMRRTDRFVARWYLLNGCFFNSMMDVFAGQLQAWPLMTEQYNALEPRYAAAPGPGPCGAYARSVVALTSLQEILFQAPLGMALYYAYHRRAAWRLPAEIVFNVCSVAGVWYFYGTEAYARFPCVSTPPLQALANADLSTEAGRERLLAAAFTPKLLFEFWLGFVAFPLLWAVVGISLILRASRQFVGTAPARR
jgi:hypothetical protein